VSVSPRLVALAVVAAGVTLGSIVHEPRRDAAVRAGEYLVLTGDFHVHGFPADGALAPWALRREARAAGVDVIGVTNHNQALTGRVAAWLAGSSDTPIVIAGEEITHADYHVIGLGLRRTVGGNRSARAAIDEIHAQGGVAIAAHPLPGFDGWDDAALTVLDGVEATHPVVEDQPEARDYMNAFHARVRTLNPRVAAIGSSDMHVTATLGDHRTILLVRERTAAGVLEAIRSGLTAGEDPQGRRYGAPAVLRMLEDARPSRRSDPNPSARRVAVALAWTGLLGVLLLRHQVNAGTTNIEPGTRNNRTRNPEPEQGTAL
jgi:hypothetical protein